MRRLTDWSPLHALHDLAAGRATDTVITGNTFLRSPGGALSITNNSRDGVIANG